MTTEPATFCRCAYPTLSRLDLCGPRGAPRYRQETCDACGGHIGCWTDKMGVWLRTPPDNAPLTKPRLEQAARLHRTAEAAAKTLGVAASSYRRACRRHGVPLP